MDETAELAARVAALTAAPLGCAFLGAVERCGLSPKAAADPATSFHLLGRTLSDVSVWRPDQAAALARILAEGPRPRPLAQAILAQPAAAWWFGPLDRQAQLRVGGRFRAALVPPVAPAGPPTDWERYAQKPAWGLYTSTDFGGVSSYLVGAAMGAGDLGPLPLPAPRERLAAASSARVYEIDGQYAWRWLCVRYPAPAAGGLLGAWWCPTSWPWRGTGTRST